MVLLTLLIENDNVVGDLLGGGGGALHEFCVSGRGQCRVARFWGQRYGSLPGCCFLGLRAFYVGYFLYHY